MITDAIRAGVRAQTALRVGILCTVVAVSGACSTKEAPGPLEPTGPTGRVRLVNLITDATRGRVNVSLEGLAFTVDLQYAQAAPINLLPTAPYAAVYTGNRAFVLKRTADTTVTVATLSFSIADGQDRTIYAIGGTGGSAVSSVVTTDDNPAAAPTETRLRIVNMSPTAGAVDIFVTAVGADLSTATARASGLAYQAASAYFTVPPGAYQVRAVPAGTSAANRGSSVVINLATTTFAGGTGRTIVLADNSTGGSPLRAFVIADR
ncbi:MAG TPA: DUF4397 domain-containing protein [Gemmatimonadaceae bacterium]|nr:DUF4397 domain-containing protein [Gemmatimonadaceae bacterium]